MIAVRRAGREDLTAIQRVRDRLPCPGPPDDGRVFQAQIWEAATGEGQGVLVAERDGRIAGYLSFVERTVPVSGDLYLWHLGGDAGASRALLAQADALARALGAQRIRVSCPPGDRVRRALLRARGYRHAYDMLDLCVSAPLRFDAPAPAGFELRDACALDIERFRALYDACFRGVWNAAPLTQAEARELFGSIDRRRSFLALSGGDYAAFALNRILLRDARRVGELHVLGVAPDFRRRGVAARLLSLSLAAHARAGCERVELRVASPNAAALSLYRRAGFRRVASLPVWERSPT